MPPSHYHGGHEYSAEPPRHMGSSSFMGHILNYPSSEKPVYDTHITANHRPSYCTTHPSEKFHPYREPSFHKTVLNVNPPDHAAYRSDPPRNSPPNLQSPVTSAPPSSAPISFTGSSLLLDTR